MSLVGENLLWQEFLQPCKQSLKAVSYSFCFWLMVSWCGWLGGIEWWWLVGWWCGWLIGGGWLVGCWGSVGQWLLLGWSLPMQFETGYLQIFVALWIVDDRGIFLSSCMVKKRKSYGPLDIYICGPLKSDLSWQSDSCTICQLFATENYAELLCCCCWKYGFCNL